jgi:phosphoserine phosphatase RsbU/P
MENAEYTLTIRSEVAELDRVRAWLAEVQEGSAPPAEVLADAELIAEELVVNIIQYGYSGEPEHPIELLLGVGSEQWRMQFADRGRPYNPLTEGPTPSLEMDDEQRSHGGWGFHLVRQLSSRLEYARQDGWNVLTVYLPLSGYPPPHTSNETE